MVETAAGEPLATIAFGMREVSIKDHRIQLNNRPYALRGLVMSAETLHERIARATPQGLIADLKKAGFNFLRVRDGAIPQPLSDAADASGLLLCDELRTESAVEQVRARRQHVSLVMWHIAHEPAGNWEAALRHVHTEDPSRLVLVGLDERSGVGMYMRPYHPEPARFCAIVARPPAPSSSRDERYLEHAADPTAPSFVSAFGPPPVEMPSLSGETDALPANIRPVFADIAALRRAAEQVRRYALRAQIQAVRVNARLAGYTAADVNVEDAHALAQVQSPLMLAIRAARTNLVPREEIPVSVVLVNDERIEPQADLSLQVVGPTNQVLWKKKRALKLSKQTREIWSGTISASGSVGTHRFVVRLMQGMKLLSQNSLELHVVEPASATEVEAHIVDPQGEWTDRCMALARAPRVKPRVYVLPPLANTIRAYPDDELVNLLAETRAGAVAIVFAPPPDWNELAARVDDAIAATIASAEGAYHYVKVHPVFDGLPSRVLMGEPYRNIVPMAAFTEPSDENITGAVTISADRAAEIGENIVVRRFGAGRIVFTHLRVLENLGRDPVADRLFANLLRHFGRRSVPSEDPQPLPHAVVEWLRRERTHGTRLWLMCGPFANWDNAGHTTEYPPEQAMNIAGTYTGWRDTVRWTRRHATNEHPVTIDLDKALGLPFSGSAGIVPETYYAYAECTAASRQAAVLRVRTRASIKAWLNGAPVLDRLSDEPDLSVETAAQITLKQGRNALLLKISRVRTPAEFSISLESASRDPLLVTWWR